MIKLTREELNYIKFLCNDAREQEGEEWGDERVVEAQTLLETEVINYLGNDIWSEWCDAAEGYRMDEDEIIDWIESKLSTSVTVVDNTFSNN